MGGEGGKASRWRALGWVVLRCEPSGGRPWGGTCLREALWSRDHVEPGGMGMGVSLKEWGAVHQDSAWSICWPQAPPPPAGRGGGQGGGLSLCSLALGRPPEEFLFPWKLLLYPQAAQV